MPLQGFIDNLPPTIKAAWLNAVDTLKFTIFNDSTTKAGARSALTEDAPLEVANGGTGFRTLAAVLASFFPSIYALINPRTAKEIAAGVVPTNYAYLPGNVLRYGATGDGTTEDYTAFSNALLAYSGAAIYVPTPASAYKISTGLVVPDNTAIIGDNKRLSKILAGGNIDVFTLGDGAQLYSLYVEGNATTGRAAIINSGKGNQTIQNVRLINFDCGTTKGVLDFIAEDSGSRISVHDAEIWQTNGTSGSNKFAVLVKDTFSAAAVPRKFSHIETGGKCAFSFGGANDFFITGSFLADLAFSSNSRAVQISACRIANQAALTIDGANHTIVGNDIAPQITIAATCTNSIIGPNSYNILPVIDNQTVGSVSVTHFRQTYTPVLTSGGTQPVLGNGTLTGFYVRVGGLIEAIVNFTVGSTTTLGTGALRFSLPVARLNGEIVDGGAVIINNGGTLYEATCQIPGNVGYTEMIRDTSGSVTFNSPAALGTGDTIRLAATYHL